MPVVSFRVANYTCTRSIPHDPIPIIEAKALYWAGAF